MAKRVWPLFAIAGLSLAVLVIGGSEKEVSEYRVVTGWTEGPFLSDSIGDSDWTSGFGDLAALRSRNGTLYVAWTEIRDYFRMEPIVVVRRGDNGLTWSEAEEIHLPIWAVGYGHGISLFEDSSGRLWLAWSARAKGSFPSQIWVSTNDNASAPWPIPSQVTRTEEWHEGYRMYDCWNPAFAELNGTVWLHWMSNRNYQKGWIWRSGSRDGGVTWSEPSMMENSPSYQAFFQTSDGSLWLGGTDWENGERVWVVGSDDFGGNWSEKKVLGVGAFPRISQVADRMYVTWQSNRYSPIVKETALRGANGQPYIWEIQTSDIWFSTKQMGEEGSWNEEAKLIERDSQEEHGILLGTAQGSVALIYVTSEGLKDEFADPPNQWRVKVATNQEPAEPIPTKEYRERRIEGVVIE